MQDHDNKVSARNSLPLAFSASKIKGSASVLYQLFWKIVAERGIGPDSFGSLMYDYITDARNAIKDTPYAHSSARGKIRKDLSRPRMSLRTFLRGMRFLQFRKIRIVIIGEDYKGRVSQHHIDVNLGERKEFDKTMAQIDEQPGDDEEEQDHNDFNEDA